MGEAPSKSSSESTPKAGRAPTLIGLLLVLAASGLLLTPLLGGRFLTDDFLILRRIAVLPTIDGQQHGGEERQGLEFLGLVGEQFHAEHDVYRPAVTLAIAAQYLASGVDPAPYHAVNLALHLLGGLMIFLLACRLAPGSSLAVRLLAPALFLVSPIQIEAVTWTAARSDTLSWLFGATSLWLRLGPRGSRHRLIAVALALGAVLSKESAIVFPALLFAVDLGARRRGEIGTMLSLLMPYCVIGLIYAGGRYAALDGFGLSYAGREDSAPEGQALEGMARSLRMVFLPFADGLGVEGRGAGIPGGRWIALLGWGLVAFGLTWSFFRGPRRNLFATLALLGALALIPFAMATGVNEIGSTLVNARGAYTPWAALALISVLALGSLPRPLALAAGLLLLVPLAAASRPTQSLYLEAHRGVETSLQSMREAVADTPENISGLVLIGYREDDYLRGGFTLSGSVDCGLKRPFTERDWRVSMVRDDEPRPDRPYLVPFPELIERHPGGAIWLHLRKGSLRPRVYDRAHLAGAPNSPRVGLTCLQPAAGSRLVIDPKSETQATEIRWRSDLPADTRWRFRLFSKLARLVDQELPPALIRREGDVWVALIPWTPDFQKFLEWYRHFAWTVVPSDGDGRELLSYSPVFFEMQRP